MEEGFSYQIFDSHGFNNRKDYNSETSSIANLLLGSSHMEAYCVGPEENVGALLNNMLPNLRTYNLGISSHNFIYCIKNISKAYEFYKPKNCVIIETSTVNPDLKSLSDVLEGKIQHHRAYKYGSKEMYLQKIFPSGKKILQQISAWQVQSLKSIRTVKPHSQVKSDDIIYATKLNDVLSFVRSRVPNDVTLLIVYHPLSKISSDGELILSDESKFYNELFANTCKNNNIIFVDVTDAMCELYSNKHKLIHGFWNTAVGVGHLNKYGHEVIAKRLAEVIKDLERSKN